MKLKRIVSTLMAFSLALSGITMYNSTVPECSFTAVAASSSVDSFLESGTDLERVSIITDESDSFSMNGYTFYKGIVFDSTNSASQLSYDVENIDSLSFTIGHVDNTGAQDAKLTFFLDDKEYDAVDLHWTMNLQKYELDVSKAKTLRIVLTRPSWACSYGLGDFKVDSDAQGKTHTTPEYSSSQEFLESGFAIEQLSIADPSTKSPTYNMNGRGFYEGIVFNNTNSASQICYNVENVDSLSFTIGHVDNSGANDAKLTIYLDDKEYDAVDLHWTMSLQEYELDVSKAKMLRIVLTRPSWACSYALGDFKVDSYKQGKAHTIPEYGSAQEFLESGFAMEQLKIANPSAKQPTYFMNEEGYYEGIVFNNTNSASQICYNVERIDSLSFTIGHVDESGENDAKLTIYLDDKEYDAIDLHSTMDLQKYKLDVSKAKMLRIVLTRPSWACSYALGNVSISNSGNQETIYGDCNDDGVFDVKDVILLQKWLLAVPDTHLDNWKAADMNEDDRLDVFDLGLMKRSLVKKGK